MTKKTKFGSIEEIGIDMWRISRICDPDSYRDFSGTEEEAEMELERICVGDCLNDVYCGGKIPKHLPLIVSSGGYKMKKAYCLSCGNSWVQNKAPSVLSKVQFGILEYTEKRNQIRR